MSMEALLALGGVVVVFLLLACVVLYLLLALGLYGLGQKQGIELSWLAFIPVAQLYLVGKLIKELKISTYVIPNREIVLPASMLAYMILGNVPLLGFLSWLAMVVLTIAALYYLFLRYKGEKAVVMTVISVVTLFIMSSVYIFNMRNDLPLDSEQKTPTVV